jgi:hypothetical protein
MTITISSRCPWSLGLGRARRRSAATVGPNYRNQRRRGLVGGVQAPLGKDLLNIAVTQREPGVQPDRMADDIGWDAVTLKEELAHRASRISISLSNQPRLCDNAVFGTDRHEPEAHFGNLAGRATW